MFDPRTISTPVFDVLDDLSSANKGNKERRKEQKSQAIELYTYLATWGLMRLKAEEKALSQVGKKEVVEKFFKCLRELSGIEKLDTDEGLKVLRHTNLSTEAYLGLTGLALALAQEFSFWAAAVYWDIKGE